MKTIIWLALTAILSTKSVAAQPKKFLRIFDLPGKKIGKGQLVSVTDSSIKLMRDSSVIEYGVSKIGFIKTKRSGGHAILISSTFAAASLALLFVAVNSSEKDSWFKVSDGEAIAAGVVYGVALGTLTGGIISAANKKMIYQVNGDRAKWMQIKQEIEK